MFHEIADLIFEKDEQLNQLDTTEIGYSNKVAVIEANYKAKVSRIIYLANHPEDDSAV